MEKYNLSNIHQFLEEVIFRSQTESDVVLYRGQSSDFPLLPSVARFRKNKDTTLVERNMLLQLKRRSKTVLNRKLEDNWDWLVYAQHFGMQTRFLDWSSNPLVALWFAVNGALPTNSDAYLYVFGVSKNMILNKLKSPDPFNINKTQVFKPLLNNERIIAQSGWFTAHAFSNKSSKWVSLQDNLNLKESIDEYRIPKSELKSILIDLNTLGVNSQTLFPDIIGVCSYINWLAENRKLNH